MLVALPGEWVVTEIDKASGIVHSLAIVNKEEIPSENVRPTLLKALDKVKGAHPQYDRFRVLLVKDEKQNRKQPRGKLKYDHVKTKITLCSDSSV